MKILKPISLIALVGLATSCSAIYGLNRTMGWGSATVLGADLLVSSASHLAGTVSSISSKFEADKNKKRMRALQPGLTKAQVFQLLGEPDRTEMYPTGENKFTKICYYRITAEKHTLFDGLFKDQSDGQFTNVVFENDILIGWGVKHLNDIYRKDPETSKA